MIRPLLFVAILNLLVTSSAWAHNMLMSFRITESKMFVEVYFEDESPGDDAKIQFFSGDTVVLESRTDSNGKWIGDLLPPGEYLLRAEHLGHVSKHEFRIDSSKTVNVLLDEKNLVGIRWTQIGVGIGVIVGFFAGIWYARRQAK